MRETILTTDELKALARNRLDSVEEPVGRIGLRAWLRETVSAVGSRLVREPTASGAVRPVRDGEPGSVSLIGRGCGNSTTATGRTERGTCARAACGVPSR